MGLLGDLFSSLLGTTSTPSLGNLKPGDVEGLARADHEVDQAERKGPAELQAAVATYGFETLEAFNDGKNHALSMCHDEPGFSTRYAAAMTAIQIESIADQYEMPAEASAPVHGVALDRLALVHAYLERSPNAMDATLARFGLNRATWSAVDETWQSRMGGHADAMSAMMLRSSYTTYLYVARAEAARS